MLLVCFAVLGMRVYNLPSAVARRIVGCAMLVWCSDVVIFGGGTVRR